MALEVAGRPILSLGEFHTLVRGLEAEHTGSGTLQGWFAGEEVGPERAHTCLNIEARLASVSPDADRMIDRGLRRLERAFPGVGK